jgi:hypothetical protein
MKDDLWAEAAKSLRTSQAAAPVRRYLEAEYEKRKDQLVSDNSDINCGKAQELRKLLKDLFEQDVDMQQ